MQARATLLLAALLSLTPLARPQQPDVPMSTRSLDFNVSALSGYAVQGVARGVEGLDYSAGASVTTPNDHIVLHRIILDRSHNIYFGYDLELFPSDRPSTVRLHFAPLSDLRGFHADFAVFHPADMTLPADQTVPLGQPTPIRLELAADGSPMLTDTLTFTPAQ